LIRVHKRDRDEGGQTLIFFVLAMPLFLAIIALVIDGSMLLVKKRSLQNAADATALAIAQDVGSSGVCAGGCLATANYYITKNGGTADPSSFGSCNGDSSKSNCYQTNYHGNPSLVEVRLTSSAAGLFTSAIGLKSIFGVSARSVAGTSYGTTITPGATNTIVHTGTTDPGDTNTIVSTITTTTGGEGAVAFTLSSDCINAPASASVPAGASIQWQGAPSSLKSLVANGGIDILGNSNKHSDHITLGKHGVAGCENYLGSPTPDPSKFPDVRTLPGAPIPYPVPPPSPAPPTGCRSTGTGNIDNTWLVPAQGHTPGVYCWTSGLLTINANGATFDGYTFFAPRIALSSNGMTFKNAPSASGQPPTVFDAYGTDVISSTTGLDTCSFGAPTNCAFSMNGQSNSITGDIFAANGTVTLLGGGASTANGGEGFIESLKLLVSGNFANFNGTGPTVGGTITTTTSTSISTRTGTTDPGFTVISTAPDSTSTTSTDLNLDQ
jgi:hypothetical protein